MSYIFHLMMTNFLFFMLVFIICCIPFIFLLFKIETLSDSIFDYQKRNK